MSLPSTDALAAAPVRDAECQRLLRGTGERSDENHLVTILALDGLARLSAATGEHDHARQLVADADALIPTVAPLLDEADRPDRALH